MICDCDDFFFLMVCCFMCDMGYKLVGFWKWECLVIVYWMGIFICCKGKIGVS